ncbi:MAG: hypothetical protein Tsb0027_25130 [Wenzhouxiangellaceae bacterium]
MSLALRATMVDPISDPADRSAQAALRVAFKESLRDGLIDWTPAALRVAKHAIHRRKATPPGVTSVV